MGLLALPYISTGKLDVYSRPVKIQVYGQNGYSKVLNYDEFVIMYDNNGRYPLWLDILQYAERIALDTRTTDINIAQQKTPRFWKTSSEKVKSVQDIINNVDGLENTVLSYDNIDLDDTTLVLAPAPFVADKIEVYKMTSEEVLDCPGYSDKQHRGNEGEGQFHLNESNIEYHRNHFLERVLSYAELYNLLEV